MHGAGFDAKLAWAFGDGIFSGGFIAVLAYFLEAVGVPWWGMGHRERLHRDRGMWLVFCS